MSEKIGGAKGTELDDEFHEMEKVCTGRLRNGEGMYWKA